MQWMAAGEEKWDGAAGVLEVGCSRPQIYKESSPWGTLSFFVADIFNVPGWELMPRFRNAVGPQIAKHRVAMDLTQEQLAARLQLLGLESLDRVGVVKIETRLRSVFDYELRIIAEALKVEVSELYPSLHSLKADLADLRRGQRSSRG